MHDFKKHMDKKKYRMLSMLNPIGSIIIWFLKTCVYMAQRKIYDFWDYVLLRLRLKEDRNGDVALEFS